MNHDYGVMSHKASSQISDGLPRSRRNLGKLLTPLQLHW